MVSSGRLKSSRVCTPVKRGLSARPNRHTPVFEKMTKSMTLARAAVSFRGPIMMSIWLATSAGTLVSWLTTTGWICTPSSRANSLPRVQDGPDHGSPAPLVFCASQGGLLTTPTRSTPALRIASTRALTPGAGGVWAKAEMPPPSKAAASAPRPTRPTALPPPRATAARGGRGGAGGGRRRPPVGGGGGGGGRGVGGWQGPIGPSCSMGLIGPIGARFFSRSYLLVTFISEVSDALSAPLECRLDARSMPTLGEFANHPLQMRTHREPGGIGLGGHDGREDLLVILLRLLPQPGRVEMLFDLGPQRAALLLAQALHAAAQHTVARGLGDVQMELHIRVLVGGLVVHLLAHGLERGKHAVEVRILARDGGHGCDLGLDQAASAQQFKRARPGLPGHRQARAAVLRLAHINARAATAPHHPVELERNDGLPHRSAADAEPIGQSALGGQTLARQKFPLSDQLMDVAGQAQVRPVVEPILVVEGLAGLWVDQLECHG